MSTSNVDWKVGIVPLAEVWSLEVFENKNLFPKSPEGPDDWEWGDVFELTMKYIAPTVEGAEVNAQRDRFFQKNSILSTSVLNSVQKKLLRELGGNPPDHVYPTPYLIARLLGDFLRDYDGLKSAAVTEAFNAIASQDSRTQLQPIRREIKERLIQEDEKVDCAINHNKRSIQEKVPSEEVHSLRRELCRVPEKAVYSFEKKHFHSLIPSEMVVSLHRLPIELYADTSQLSTIEAEKWAEDLRRVLTQKHNHLKGLTIPNKPFQEYADFLSWRKNRRPHQA